MPEPIIVNNVSDKNNESMQMDEKTLVENNDSNNRISIQEKINYIEALLVKNSENPISWFNLGFHNAWLANVTNEVERKVAGFDQAICYYKKAIELRQNYDSAWNNLGIVYYYRAKATGLIRDDFLATQCYDNALNINPKNEISLTNKDNRCYGIQKRLKSVGEQESALNLICADPAFDVNALKLALGNPVSQQAISLISKPNDAGYTPLHFAAQSTNAEIFIPILLEALGTEAKNALQLKTKNGLCTLDLLNANPKKPNIKQINELFAAEREALASKVISGNLEQLSQLKETELSAINAPANDGDSALHKAVSADRLPNQQNVIEFLVENNASVLQQNRVGKTALDIARERNLKNIVVTLQSAQTLEEEKIETNFLASLNVTIIKPDVETSNKPTSNTKLVTNVFSLAINDIKNACHKLRQQFTPDKKTTQPSPMGNNIGFFQQPDRIDKLSIFREFLDLKLSDLFIKSMAISKGLADNSQGTPELLAKVLKFGSSFIPVPFASTVISVITSAAVAGYRHHDTKKHSNFVSEVSNVHEASTLIYCLVGELTYRYQFHIDAMDHESLELFAECLIKRMFNYVNQAAAFDKKAVIMALGAGVLSLTGNFADIAGTDTMSKITQEIASKAKLPDPMVSNGLTQFFENIPDMDTFLEKAVDKILDNDKPKLIALNLVAGTSLVRANKILTSLRMNLTSGSNRRQWIPKISNKIIDQLSENNKMVTLIKGQEKQQITVEILCIYSDVICQKKGRKSEYEQYKLPSALQTEKSKLGIKIEVGFCCIDPEEALSRGFLTPTLWNGKLLINQRVHLLSDEVRRLTEELEQAKIKIKELTQENTQLKKDLADTKTTTNPEKKSMTLC